MVENCLSVGVTDSTLVYLIEKVRSWISWVNSDSNSSVTLVTFIEKVRYWISWGNSYSNSSGLNMTDKNCKACCHCRVNTLNSCTMYHCESCGMVFCGKCIQGLVSLDTAASSRFKKTSKAVFNIKMCKLCFELGPVCRIDRKFSGKVYPSKSPRQSPEPLSLSFNGDESFSNHPSPVSVRHPSSRSDEDEGEDSTSHFLNMSNKYFHDTSDVDSVCLSARDEFSGFTSPGSSPSDSPSRIHITSDRVGPSVQREHGGNSSPHDGSSGQEQAVLEKPAQEKFLEPFNFESNGLIWIPPPPDDVINEEENSFFTYDNDDDDEVGESGAMFSPKVALDHKKRLGAVVEGHFRDLVLQLLLDQRILLGKENSSEDWMNIIPEIAWQAANFIKPDTSRGGSMDPCDYVKIKCVASGSPSESKLIKGVVCAKNLKHKRMTSQYRNTRLMLLGGSLEYQRVANQLASFDTLLQQENDHLKMIVSKIEAHHPNVLLVEKSASSFAQDQLLAKDISLVLNVKRPLLERIARCSRATVTPSTDHIHKTRLGHCELFHIEKITEEHEPVNQSNKRPAKTLMFFEGCPKRLGCTVLLKGSSKEELKKVKNVVQYAVFAAYHLLLETSFLADEGATIPNIGAKFSYFSREKATLDSVETTKFRHHGIESADLNLESGFEESLCELGQIGYEEVSVPDEFRYRKSLSDASDKNLDLDMTLDDVITHGPIGSPSQMESQIDEVSEYYSANDNSQSILVSFSSHCILNGTVCERSRLLRVKFYSSSDKPLGRYLKEDLFDESSHCQSCNESTEAHAICYTHQDGNLMINVKRLSSVMLPGKEESKIWMWHRCLKCTHTEGVPPVTRRVAMSDAAWGLSFGKFLELSFSNHATGNRVASCGHSLQRDCLRFFGLGNIVAFIQYSPINILSVRLPPAILDFGGRGEQTWIRKEASELLSKAEALYAEISVVLQGINSRSLSSMHDFSDASELHRHVLKLNDMLAKEQNFYEDLLHLPNAEIHEQDQEEFDILEINRLRHSLLIRSHVWDRRLYLLDSLLWRSSPKSLNDIEALIGPKNSETYPKDCSLYLDLEDNGPENPKFQECPVRLSNIEEQISEPYIQEDYILPTCPQKESDEVLRHEGSGVNFTSLERVPSAASILSDKIDSAWCGADLTLDMLNSDVYQKDNPSFTKLSALARLNSFDTAQRIQERRSKTPSSSLYLSTLRSFHASGDYRYMLRDPVSSVQRTYSQVPLHEAEKLNLTTSLSPSIIPVIPLLPEGGRLMVPHNGPHDIVLTVYDNEPTSIISYALSSKEYADWVADKPNVPERGPNASVNRMNAIASDLSSWKSFGSLDLDYIHYGNYSSEDALVTDPKISPHFRISFEDESSATAEKTRFYVTCYYAKQFGALRTRCCPSEIDIIRSLSRCKRWSAQGGKSNVYFAKSFDERFIIKQVTKTELESFKEFSSEYFTYLPDALSSGGPTCLAKILGIYQVAVKPSKGGKETKMDLMVMENLFFGRSISKVYDLKGSSRSRYNSDTTGANKVLLDMNLLETLRTNPIFLGSKAKRKLERAVWNDTSFLASVDVMDYSLLVGVDEERKELVMGIIDYMRQYTWDKHLETWVKASGILGGPKNASPTIVSPKQYKKRFRKAMTSYFLTVPDQWSS